MSRQIRRQIPQKQKKKRVDRNACLLVFILIFFGILTFLLLTARDNNKLNSTLDETCLCLLYTSNLFPKRSCRKLSVQS